MSLRCGDPKRLSISLIKAMTIQNSISTSSAAPQWFPMRIRNSSLSRLKLMKERLDHHEDVDDTYVPLAFMKTGQKEMDFAPCLLNYIFVRSTFVKLVQLKSNMELFEPLRFVMHPAYDDKLDRHNEVLIISDKAMEDYMRITKEENEKVIFLENMRYASKPSREVQIIKGEFAGVVGRIKRIKGYRCVVLPIGSEMAVAVMDVPNSYLRYLTDEELQKFREQDERKPM